MSSQNNQFSNRLEGWLKSDSPKTLTGLSNVFAEKSFAIIILLLMAPSALPIPTGGVTNVLEIIVMLLALEMILGRKTVWLPKRWRNIKLNPTLVNKAIPSFIKKIRWFEKWSKPRQTWLLKSHFAARFYGVCFLILALTAFFAPPFSGLDTLPSMGAVLIALAIILEDSLFLLAGSVIGTLGIVVYIGLGKLVLNFFRSTF